MKAGGGCAHLALVPSSDHYEIRNTRNSTPGTNWAELPNSACVDRLVGCAKAGTDRGTPATRPWV
eukprot:3693628-Rhodomonas_salina.1